MQVVNHGSGAQQYRAYQGRGDHEPPPHGLSRFPLPIGWNHSQPPSRSTRLSCTPNAGGSKQEYAMQRVHEICVSQNVQLDHFGPTEGEQISAGWNHSQRVFTATGGDPNNDEPTELIHQVSVCLAIQPCCRRPRLDLFVRDAFMAILFVPCGPEDDGIASTPHTAFTTFLNAVPRDAAVVVSFESDIGDEDEEKKSISNTVFTRFHNAAPDGWVSSVGWQPPPASSGCVCPGRLSGDPIRPLWAWLGLYLWPATTTWSCLSVTHFRRFSSSSIVPMAQIESRGFSNVLGIVSY
ncbi:hypothetical protein FN846DRAFT_902290 [Sphaerosporella brunnea]|uniref:Uncharacterized protein n=1 Tax=Sphaerosporella brunnea TaxID=1250544 RepID=A0A5J5F9R0_9PEZI|nr:hypothetical protein FN846DRAFT_902290 [Sphaerosporella brunnea]